MAGLVFDANVVIALFDENNFHHPSALRFYLQSSSSEIYLSTITHAEVLTHPASNGKLNFFVKNIKSAGFSIIDLTDELSVEVAKVRSKTGLKMPDACVLALAMSLKADVVTFDKELFKKAQALKAKAHLVNR
jgi:predicted nucleic acid-binding protein